ncbi:hypothetical protein D3C81_1817650 [compost metagenome]
MIASHAKKITLVFSAFFRIGFLGSTLELDGCWIGDFEENTAALICIPIKHIVTGLSVEEFLKAIDERYGILNA